MLLLAGTLVTTSCKDDNDSNPILVQPTEFTLNTPALENATIDLMKSKGIQLTWSQPKFTEPNAPVIATYTIQVSSTGTFTNEYDSSADDNSIADYASLDETFTKCDVIVSTEAIDKALMLLNQWEDNSSIPATHNITLRVKAAVQDASFNEYNPIVSNAVSFTTIPYYLELKNADPERWYLVGADIANGKWESTVPTSQIPMQPVKDYEFDAKTGTGEITWTGYLAGNGFKLVKIPGEWNFEWGQGSSFGTFIGKYTNDDPAGSNIEVPEAGIYTVKLNTAKKELSVEAYEGQAKVFDNVYITGSFNSWTNDTPMSPVHIYDGAENHDWTTTIALEANAEVKFYDGVDWNTLNYGAGNIITISDGFYDYGNPGGSNIIVPTAGNYLVIFNDITGYYRFILQQ